MEDLIYSIINDESPSTISDSIKDALAAKAMERIDAYRPEVAASMFNQDE